MWFTVNSIDWDDKFNKLLINGSIEEMKGPYSIEFVDRKIFVNSKKDVYRAKEHLKFIKEQMKLQEMEKDFE
jgi:protein gp37